MCYEVSRRREINANVAKKKKITTNCNRVTFPHFWLRLGVMAMDITKDAAWIKWKHKQNIQLMLCGLDEAIIS